MKKRMLSFLLALSIVFSLAVPAMAADPTTPYTAAAAEIQIDSKKVELDGGKGLTVEWSIHAPSFTGTSQVILTYDATKLTPYATNTKALSVPAAWGGLSRALKCDSDTWAYVTGSAFGMKAADKDYGTIMYVVTTENSGSAPCTDCNTGLTKVAEMYFKLVGTTDYSDLTQNDFHIAKPEELEPTGQSSAVNIVVNDTNIIYGNLNSTASYTFANAPKLKVAGAELPAGKVELKTITLAANATTATVPTNNTDVTIAAPTMTVTEQGASTNGITFGLYTADDGTTAYSKTGVSVNETNGTVTVSKAAATSLNDGTNKCYLIAKKDAIVSNAIELTITKAAPVVADYKVTLNPNSNSIKAGANVTLTVSDIKDQYGNAKNDVTTATFTKSTTNESGISVSGSGLVGTVSVAAGTAAGKSDKIKVTVGTVDKEFTFTVADKDASKVTGLTANPASPKVNTDFTVSIVGTGNGEDITWTVDSGSASIKTPSTGTSCTFTAGATTGTVVIKAVQGDSATTKGFTKTLNVTVADKDPSAKPTVNIAITGGTADGKVVAGEAVTLTANVSGAGVTEANCTFAWTKGGNPAGTGKTLSIAAFDPATDAVKYTCVVTHTQDANHAPTASDPAEITLSEKTKDVITVEKKTTASQTEGALDVKKLVDVKKGAVAVTDSAILNAVAEKTTAKVYKYVEAVKDAEGNVTEAAKYEKVEGNLTAGTYYLDVAVAAITDQADYKVDAVAGKGAPNDATAPDDLAGYVKLTVNKSTGGGGAVSSNYTVTFNAGAKGTISGDAKVTVKRGETITGLPAVTPNAGYIFIGWSADGKTVIDPGTLKVNKSTTLTALYIAPYISGYPDSTFRPDAQVTRAEIVSMLARLNKDFKAGTAYTGTATDVDSGAWYANAVNFGMSKGFISGYKDGSFQPNGNITRGEFASMMARYMGLANGTKQFTDTADHWASGAIAALAEAGIVNGYKDGSFAPNGELTRAEAVQMINTALKVQALADEPYVEPVDVAAAHWAYNQILAAMNTDIEALAK